MWNRKTFSRFQKGLSLIEVVVTLVLITIAFGAIAGLVATLAGKSANPVLQTQGLYLAEGMMEEIMLRGFEDPDGIAEGCGVARDLWDNLADYNCLNTPVAIRSSLGANIPGLDQYRIAVRVGNPQTLAGVTTRQVEVRVTHLQSTINIRLVGWKGLY